MKRFLAITTALWLLLGAVAGAQTYAQSEGSLDIGTNTVNAGDTITVTGDGFAPDSEIEILLSVAGTDTVLGTATADATGAFSTEITIPADFEGTGVLFARGTSADGGTRVLGIAINGGSVEQLAFTGSSGNTRWMVGAAVALIIFGAGALFTGSRRQSLVG